MKLKGWLILVIIALIIIGVLWHFRPSQEKDVLPKGPDDYNSEEDFMGFPEDEPLDEIEQYAKDNYPLGPYTTVEVQQNRILFGGETEPHEIYFFEPVLLGDYNTIVIDGIEFAIMVDNTANIKEGDYFYILMENLTDDLDKLIEEPMVLVAKRKIEFNKFNTDSISFPIYDPETFEPLIEVKYDYYIAKHQGDKPKIYFLLAKQDFKVQFDKNLRFLGTDSLQSKKANTDYYLPDLPLLGNDEFDAKYLIAWLQLDEDGDKEFEITVFVDTATGELLDVKKTGLKNYSFAIEFEGKGLGNEDQKITNAFGTIFEVKDTHLYARMPKKE